MVNRLEVRGFHAPERWGSAAAFETRPSGPFLRRAVVSINLNAKQYQTVKPPAERSFAPKLTLGQNLPRHGGGVLADLGDFHFQLVAGQE